MKSCMSVIVLIFFCLMVFQLPAEAGEYYTFEVGSVIASPITELSSTKFDPVSAVQFGYRKTKDNTFFHVFWGTLVSEHPIRTQYLFGEVGYHWELEDPYYIDFSFGIGRVDLTDEKLPTNNMFTERISLGYKQFYLAFRHISNGGMDFDNPGGNGRNTLTFGMMF